MQNEHGVTQQGLGVQRGRSVSCEQVAEIEREGRVGNAVAVRGARGQPIIPPTGVFRCLKKKEVNSIGRHVVDIDAVRRLRGDGDSAAESRRDFSDAILKKIFQDTSNRSDGQRAAHRATPFRDFR